MDGCKNPGTPILSISEMKILPEKSSMKPFKLVPFGLVGLCLSDLARSQAASGRSEDAAETYDRALDTMVDEHVPFFRVSCLAGKADVCRRFEAWEEAERSLLEAKRVLEDAGVRSGHPMMTYINQRFDFWVSFCSA